jgi:hypothetical protein
MTFETAAARLLSSQQSGISRIWGRANRVAAYRTNEITAAASPARRQCARYALSTKPIAAGGAVDCASRLAKDLLWLLVIGGTQLGPRSRDNYAVADYLRHPRLCHSWRADVLWDEDARPLNKLVPLRGDRSKLPVVVVSRFRHKADLARRLLLSIFEG